MDIRRCCAQNPEAKEEWEYNMMKQLESIPDETHLNRIYEVLSAISHPIRLKIAFLLLQQDQCVCELVQLTGKAPNLISHHLAIMRKNGIIKPYMKSKDKYYKIKEILFPILRTIKKLNI